VTDHLEWPFFGDRHRALAAKLEQWCAVNLGNAHGADIDAECRSLVRSLGQAGFLKLCVGGGDKPPDVRRLSAMLAGCCDHDLSAPRAGTGNDE